MTHKWLYLALFALLVSLANHWIYFFMILILAFLWSHKTKKINSFFLLGFLLVSYIFFQFPVDSQINSNVGEVIEVRDSYVIAKIEQQKVLVYTNQELSNHVLIEVEGDFEEIESLSNFFSFDFSLWCKRRGITQSISPSEIRVIEEVAPIRNAFYVKVLSIKNEEVKKWCLKFIYGLNQEEDDFFMIFSSGVHLSLILRLIKSRFEKEKQPMMNVLCIIFLVVYQYFIRTNFAMQRLILVSLTSLCFEKESPKDQLGIIILACLFAFPYCIYELAFLIPTFFRLISLFSTRYIAPFVKQIVVLLPLQLYLFSKCNVFSLLTFRGLRYLYALGFIIAHFVGLFPFLSFVMQGYLLLMPMIRFLSDFTFVLLGKPSLLWMILFYYVVFRYISRVNKLDQTCLLGISLMLLFQPYLDPRTHVYFLNVGQGDSCLILLPFNQGSMLIDVAGSMYRNIPRLVIQPYLDAHGLRSLDVVVLTHQDLDHAGGLEELKDIVSIASVVDDKQSQVKLGNLPFETLLPEEEFNNENDNSLVLATKIGGLNYLFMGDASLQFENEFLKRYQELPIDILKIGHHGSKSSTSKPFIQALSPQVSVISVAKNNRFGHPNESVLKTLSDYQSKVLQTSIHGAIHIQSIFNFHFITTSHKEFGIIGTGDKNELFNLW